MMWKYNNKVYIEVDTIEDLMRLYSHYDSLIIGDSYSEGEPPYYFNL